MPDPFAKKVEKKAVDVVSVPERNTIPEVKTVPEQREPSIYEIEKYVQRRKNEEEELKKEAMKDKVPYFKPVKKEPVEEPVKEEPVEEPEEKTLSPKDKYSQLKKDMKKMDKDQAVKEKAENKELLKRYKEREHNKKIAFKQSRREEKQESKKYSETYEKSPKRKEKVPRDKIKDVIVEKRGIDWARAIMFLSILGIVGIIFFSQMISPVSNGLAILLWLFGMMCFFPLGLILGWLFLDPYMRCKIMRRMRHKNYGMVNFVHKGGRRIDVRIKNFDDDVIVQDTKLWLINKEGVHYIDVNGDKVLHAEINSENIATLPSNVPSLFLDSETMIPLTFYETKSKTNPQVAGATLLGYVNNQIAKNLFFKKQMTMFYMILIGITAMTLVLVIGMYMEMEEMKELVPALKSQISQLTDVVSQLTNPVP